MLPIQILDQLIHVAGSFSKRPNLRIKARETWQLHPINMNKMQQSIERSPQRAKSFSQIFFQSLEISFFNKNNYNPCAGVEPFMNCEDSEPILHSALKILQSNPEALTHVSYFTLRNSDASQNFSESAEKAVVEFYAEIVKRSQLHRIECMLTPDLAYKISESLGSEFKCEQIGASLSFKNEKGERFPIHAFKKVL